MDELARPGRSSGAAIPSSPAPVPAVAGQAGAAGGSAVAGSARGHRRTRVARRCRQPAGKPARERPRRSVPAGSGKPAGTAQADRPPSSRRSSPAGRPGAGGDGLGGGAAGRRNRTRDPGGRCGVPAPLRRPGRMDRPAPERQQRRPGPGLGCAATQPGAGQRRAGQPRTPASGPYRSRSDSRAARQRFRILRPLPDLQPRSRPDPASRRSGPAGRAGTAAAPTGRRRRPSAAAGGAPGSAPGTPVAHAQPHRLAGPAGTGLAGSAPAAPADRRPGLAAPLPSASRPAAAGYRGLPAAGQLRLHARAAHTTGSPVRGSADLQPGALRHWRRSARLYHCRLGRRRGGSSRVVRAHDE